MSARDQIFKWVASGRLKAEDAARALDVAGVTPRLGDWRRFAELLLFVQRGAIGGSAGWSGWADVAGGFEGWGSAEVRTCANQEIIYAYKQHIAGISRTH